MGYAHCSRWVVKEEIETLCGFGYCLPERKKVIAAARRILGLLGSETSHH